MTGEVARRAPTAVLGSAVVVGVIAAVPIALLIVLGPAFGRALVSGASLAQAWQATAPTGDDWEVLPAFVVGAVFVGLVISLVSAAVWLVIIKRGSVPFAALGAAAAAAAVPLLLLAFVNWELGVSVAVPAALVALVAAPLVGRAPHRPDRTVA